MRLAYLVSRYPAITHTFILREIRALRSQGFDIEVVSIQPPDRLLEELNPEEREEASRTWSVLAAGLPAIAGAHLATLFSMPGGYFRGLWSTVTLARWNLRSLLLNWAYFAEAVVAGHHMHRRGITHLHTHFSSTVALFLNRVFPIQFSATIHGPEEFDDVRGFHMAEKTAEAAFLIAISQYARSQILRASHTVHWHKVEVVALGVDPNLFVPRQHRERPERFELLSVGRLAPAKAHALLIEAVGLLVDRGAPPLRLRIVGGGPEHAKLTALIQQKKLQDYVVLEGPCNQDRVRQLYRETDLFVLASFAEGVPVVLMEAMAMEIPCLATWITGIPELIRHGEDGWLVAPSDGTVFSEAIAMLMANEPLRQKLGCTGRQRIQQRYNLIRNTQQLADLFRLKLAAQRDT